MQNANAVNQAMGAAVGVVDSTLKRMNLPYTLNDLISSVDDVENLKQEIQSLAIENDLLRQDRVSAVQTELTYTSEEVKLKTLFPSLQGDYTLPYFNWDAVNTDVPRPSVHYKPDMNIVAAVVNGLVHNDNTWIYGPTGCGKDEALNYIASKMNIPLITISFDADITRTELIGRDHLKVDGDGATYSEFIEAILPKALRQPCILALDEFDFIREDVAYIMQTVLNEGKLVILEKGGEVIRRHPNCYIVATANTNGKDDDLNRHNGARELSSALLDRFTNWVKADYLSENAYTTLISQLSKMDMKPITTFVRWIKGYQELYLNGDVVTPLSNRAIVAIALRAKSEEELLPNLKAVFLNRLNEYDYAKASELFQKLGYQL